MRELIYFAKSAFRSFTFSLNVTIISLSGTFRIIYLPVWRRFISTKAYVNQLVLCHPFNYLKMPNVLFLVEPLPPILPSKFGTGPQYFDIKNAISIRFKYGGTWGALGEVRDWLQKLFKSMEGQARFRLYEFNTLMNFWRLIFWANQLWRGVLIEEEETELVLKNRQQWVKELRGWTGLVLKCDWRDYFSEVCNLSNVINNVKCGNK